MMGNEVVKNWMRLKEYFDVWISLVEQNLFVRNYCIENKLIEKILDFLLEDYSPFQRTIKRYSMGSQYYSVDFQHPMELFTLLLKHGYELNELEKSCIKNYAFMQKIIKYSTNDCNLIEHVCKDNSIHS